MGWDIAYLLLGAVAGFLAGLFGVGGGMILVPAFLFIFDAQRFPSEHSMHLALGTSMATILFTSLASTYKHHQLGAVNWRVVRELTPGILIGAASGALLASSIPTRALGICFALFVYFAAAQILFDKRPPPSRQLPDKAGMALTGVFTGFMSSIVSIGGGTIVTPFLLWCNVSVRNAIGTSAAIGFPVAIGGTASYIATGLNVSGLPPHTLGFIYLPGLLWTATVSVIAAPFGARAAHRLPIEVLRKFFAVLLLTLATKLLIRVLS
jgi:uncharacterized membrane protein YfcA